MESLKIQNPELQLTEQIAQTLRDVYTRVFFEKALREKVRDVLESRLDYTETAISDYNDLINYEIPLNEEHLALYNHFLVEKEVLKNLLSD